MSDNHGQAEQQKKRHKNNQKSGQAASYTHKHKQTHTQTESERGRKRARETLSVLLTRQMEYEMPLEALGIQLPFVSIRFVLHFPGFAYI